MLQGIKDFFIDIRLLKNIEAWIIFLVTIVIVLLDLFDIVDLSILSEVFLALLATLLYMTIKINKNIEKSISNLNSDSLCKLYSKRSELPLHIHSINAAKKEICILSIHATSFIRQNEEVLKDKLRSKCKIRILIFSDKDEKGNSNIAVKQFEELTDHKAIMEDIAASIAYVRPWLSNLSTIERRYIEIRLYEIFPSALYLLIDKDHSNGYAIVSPTLPYIKMEFRPAFSVDNKNHQFLLSSIAKSFEEIWKNSRIFV